MFKYPLLLILSFIFFIASGELGAQIVGRRDYASLLIIFAGLWLFSRVRFQAFLRRTLKMKYRYYHYPYLFLLFATSISYFVIFFGEGPDFSFGPFK